MTKMQKIRPVFYLFILLLIFTMIWLSVFQPQSITVLHTYLLKKISPEDTNIIIDKVTPTTIPLQGLTQKPTELPSGDYSQLVNLTNFQFLHLVECTKNDRYPKLLVAVHTAPGNVAKRQAIRETWGMDRPEIKLVFMMGVPQKPEEKKIAAHEHETFKDIVQGNFDDAYKNLTYKHVMVLKYVVYHCPKITYLLKTDDDVFINMPNLLTYLQDFNNNKNIAKHQELLLCSPMIGSPAIREVNKWRVSFDEFPDEFYPPYCSGYAEFFTPDTVFRLYHEAQKIKYLWVDDAFVTGIAREAANIKITPLPSTLTITYKEMETIFQMNNTFPNMVYQFMLGPMNVQEQQVRHLWNIVTHRIIK